MPVRAWGFKSPLGHPSQASELGQCSRRGLPRTNSCTNWLPHAPDTLPALGRLVVGQGPLGQRPRVPKELPGLLRALVQGERVGRSGAPAAAPRQACAPAETPGRGPRRRAARPAAPPTSTPSPPGGPTCGGTADPATRAPHHQAQPGRPLQPRQVQPVHPRRRASSATAPASSSERSGGSGRNVATTRSRDRGVRRTRKTGTRRRRRRPAHVLHNQHHQPIRAHLDERRDDAVEVPAPVDLAALRSRACAALNKLGQQPPHPFPPDRVRALLEGLGQRPQRTQERLVRHRVVRHAVADEDRCRPLLPTCSEGLRHQP